MNINRQAYDQNVGLHSPDSIKRFNIHTDIYCVDVNNNDGARVQTMNDRCDFSEIKEIKRNKRIRMHSKRT